MSRRRGHRLRAATAGLIAAMSAAAPTASWADVPVAHDAVTVARVPCSPHTGKGFDCVWFSPGDEISGGALVVYREQVMGYLHHNTNWVECQQRGVEVTNSAGGRNHW